MPDLGTAPYIGPETLLGQQGDASLGGGTINFDPANKQPFRSLEETIARNEAQNFHAAEAQKQRQFTAQQSQQAHKQDVMSKLMDYDHMDKVMQYKQRIQDRDDTYKRLSEQGGSAFNMKGPNGNDISFSPLPEDQKYLTELTHDLRKKSVADPTGALSSPDFQGELDKHAQLTRLASVRAIEWTKLKQEYSQAAIPEEKERIQQVMDKIRSTPLPKMEMPDVHLPAPQTKPFINPDRYKDGKGLESFDGGEGYPNKEYTNILYATDQGGLNQAYLSKNMLIKSGLPEVTNPKAFTQWQQNVNEITSARGLPPIQLGTVTPEGKIVLNEDPRAIATALELQRNGALTAPDELEAAKTTEQKAKARKETAEASIKEKELALGKIAKPTKEELVEQQNIKAVKGVYGDVKKVFDVTGKKEMYTSAITKDALKFVGINPEEYKVYQAPDADKYIGIEKKEVSNTIPAKDGSKKVEKSIKGDSEKADGAFLVENKKSGGRELVYITKGKVVARVPEKDAIINRIKHEAKYNPSQYAHKVAQVEEVYGKVDAPENPKPAEKQDDQLSVIEARLVPITWKTKSGALIPMRKDPITGKKYKL